MSIFNATWRARIQAQITTKTAQLTAANTTMESLLEKEIDEYRFDSGQASQRVKRRDIEKLAKIIHRLEAQIDLLQRKLDGYGLASINLRRR
jgi:hypothetical protein